MKVKVKKFGKLIDDEVKTMLVWQNDPKIRHLHCVAKSVEEHQKTVTFEGFKKELSDPKYFRYGIYAGGLLAGECSFIFDHPAALKQTPKTAWIGILIGEEKFRGHGLGRIALEFMENEILSLGGRRIELGVFEYNRAAIHLYEKLGYQRFKIIPEFTWWNERWWSDHRYEKRLRNRSSA